MTAIITPDTPLYLRGDMPGLLDGYCGFAVVASGGRAPYLTPFTDHPSAGDGVHLHGLADWQSRFGNDSVPSLPLSRPEAHYRAACWVKEAHKADLWHFLPGSLKLPRWVAVACLWASCVRLNAGMSAVLGIGATWREARFRYPPDSEAREHTHRPNLISPERHSVCQTLHRDTLSYFSLIGEETRCYEASDEGKAKADEAALVKGYALLDTAESLRVAVPDGAQV